jgi:hypothetical protein
MEITTTGTGHVRKANHTRETARVQANGNDSRQVFRKSLRNANINYRNGWFFVTFQVAHNKSIFGAIVGERCELNELGRQVEATSTARCDMPMKSGAAIFHPTAYLPRC